ncbi:MAG: type II toxin-antitoxin system HicA family toxin [Planctomycetes bacterium]|nr:type II toxin-antitoxin system HicA family toxin [Planctomycetota bacterium]
MSKFPVDAPKAKVIKTLESLGFRLVRQQEHIAMVRQDPDGSRTPLTLPNHRRIKGSTLRAICSQASIPREEFLQAYEEA